MAGMLSPGDSLCQGRYEVQRLLAQGGMGNVYLAEDTRFGNRVALKENLDATPEAQRQFQFEANKPWARKLAIGALSLLLGVGVLGVALALHQGLLVPPDSSYLSQVAALPFVQVKVRSSALAAGSYALALVVGCAFAIRYLQSPSIRSYFGA